MSKKIIWIVFHSDDWGKARFPAMTTSFASKVKNFLIKKIKEGECFYEDETLSKTKQIAKFKEDWKNRNRGEINSKLCFFYYDYYYDGEEI